MDSSQMTWYENRKKNIDFVFDLGKSGEQVKMNCSRRWNLFLFTTKELQDAK